MLGSGKPKNVIIIAEEFLRRVTGRGDASLNEFQVRAVSALTSGKSVLAVAPTGTGKTVVGAAAVAMYGRAIWVEPTRALMREMYNTLRKGFPGKRIRISNKDYSLPYRLLRSSDIIVTSPFKAGIYLSMLTPRDFPLIVFDEIHTVSRSPLVETVATMAKTAGFRIVALSATLSDRDADDVSKWLGAVPVIYKERRAVPLHHNIVSVRLSPAGRLSYMDRSSEVAGVADSWDDLVADVVDKVLKQDTKNRVLVWVPWRKTAERLARRIANRLSGWVPEKTGLVSGVVRGGASDSVLKTVIKHGVGIHHAGISSHNLTLVENAFRNGDLLVVVSCYTLSHGVNLPVSHVIIPFPYSYDLSPLTPTMYKQIAGRAGRPGYDVEGHSLILAFGEAEEELAKLLINEEPNPVIPSLDNPYTITKVVAYFMSKGRFDDVEEFISNTLTAVKFGDSGKKLLMSLARSVKDYVISEYFEEVNGKLAPKGPEEAMAAKMMLHPRELAVYRAVVDGRPYEEVLMMVVGIAREMEKDLNITDDDVETFLREGFLAYYRTGTARDLADIGLAVLEAGAVLARRVHGADSEQYRKVSEFIERYMLGDNDLLKELSKKLRHDEVKRLVRNVEHLVFYKHHNVTLEILPHLISAAVEAIFGMYKTLNVRRVKAVVDTILQFFGADDQTRDYAYELVKLKINKIAKENNAEVVGTWPGAST